MFHNVTQDVILKPKIFNCKNWKLFCDSQVATDANCWTLFELIANATPEGEPVVITNDSVLEIGAENTALFTTKQVNSITISFRFYQIDIEAVNLTA